MVNDPLLDPDGVAAWLKVSVSTLYYWRHRGEGPPAFRVGRHLRYRAEDVRAWVAAQAASGDATPAA